MTIVEEIHVEDIGTELGGVVADAEGDIVDLSAATILQFKFRKPDGSSTTVDASFKTDGTDGHIIYITTSGFLDQAGDWDIQGRIVLSAWGGHTNQRPFVVYPNIS